MLKNIYLIVGASGSGKTTLVEELERRYGYKAVQSYTTRPPRYDGETGHIFVSKEEFDSLGQMIAYTKYNGFEYGVNQAVVDSHDLYVIDPPGVQYMLEKYSGKKRIVVIGLPCDEIIRKYRMLNRGDSAEKVESRLTLDREVFDFSRFTFPLDMRAPAEASLDQLVSEVAHFIQKRETEDQPIHILQMRRGADKYGNLFCGTEWLHSRLPDLEGTYIDGAAYDVVWRGDIPLTHGVVDEVYVRFNRDDRPGKETMRSLSVGDIVDIAYQDQTWLNGRWYCDSFGWARLAGDKIIGDEGTWYNK